MTLVESETSSFYFCHLEISGVEAGDAGAYRVVAKNAQGEGHATINLNFEEGERDIFLLALETLRCCFPALKSVFFL